MTSEANSSHPECSVCGGISFEEKAYPCTEKNTGPLNFDSILDCNSCGFGFAYPKLEQNQLDEFYQDGSYWSHHDENPYQLAHNKIQAEERVNTLFSKIDRSNIKSVLDIGAGHGHMAHWLSKHLGHQDITYNFIEHDPNQSQKIIDTFSKINPQKISIADCKNKKFDVIFANHVLEHVEDPIQFLQSILGSLNEGGHTYIEVPNRDDEFKANVFPHTLFFTKSSLLKISSLLKVETQLLESFGSRKMISLSDNLGFQKLQKLVSLLYNWSVDSNLFFCQKFLNHWMYEYKTDPNGIWLRWVFQKKA